MLERTAQQLPRTMDETYDRILCNLTQDHQEEVVKLLQSLVFSARPMTIEELAEVLAVNTSGKPWLNYDARPWDPKDILKMCSGLITAENVEFEEEYFPKDYGAVFADSYDGASAWGDNLDWVGSVKHKTNTHVIILAHFSVQEYIYRTGFQPPFESVLHMGFESYPLINQ